MSVAEKTELFQLALLSCIDGIGRRTLRKVLKYRTARNWSWHDLWVPSEEVVTFLSLSAKQIESIKKANQEQLNTALLTGLTSHSFRLIGTESEEYPLLLKESDDPPPVLFVKGAVMDWQKLAVPIAVVGTRNITSYGRYATEKIVSELVALGATIVSGLMYGVDSVAHLVATQAGGSTIAVLGYGFDHCYPIEHQPVLTELLDKGATFISEYPPWKIAHKGNFPARNSIVAGMSAAVVVTEAAAKSGSMITAQCAVDEGRAVCAVPGPISNPYCAGTKWLINEGATLVSSGAEVLEQIYQPTLASHDRSSKKEKLPKRAFTKQVARFATTSEIGQRILDCLAQMPADLESLQLTIEVEQRVLLAELTSLEMSLLVRRQGSQWSSS